MTPPTPAEFELAVDAFSLRYAPTQGSPAERLEFAARLRHLLALAARLSALAPGRQAVDEASPGPIGRIELAASTVPEMRRRKEGWIARLKREEEMDGSVPWPTAARDQPGTR
jgi:hypothetical protein